jgi:tryptophan synthase alpha chain
VTPTTPDVRVAAIDGCSTGFLYCVSTTGVTGAGGARVADGYLARVKRHAPRNPVLVGFGIAGPEDARRVSRDADGVIIGSALIRKLAAGEGTASICLWVREVKDAMVA